MMVFVIGWEPLENYLNSGEAGFSRGIGDDNPIRKKAQKQHVELRIKGEAQKVLLDDLKRNSAAEDP
jgi:hypothetical protein